MENIFTEFCDLQALFEGEHWETADSTVIIKKDRDLELDKYYDIFITMKALYEKLSALE